MSQWAPVDNSQGFWTVASASASVGGRTINRRGNTSIMDTGTTLCLVRIRLSAHVLETSLTMSVPQVDDTFLKQIYDAIPGSKAGSSYLVFLCIANGS